MVPDDPRENPGTSNFLSKTQKKSKKRRLWGSWYAALFTLGGGVFLQKNQWGKWLFKDK